MKKKIKSCLCCIFCSIEFAQKTGDYTTDIGQFTNSEIDYSTIRFFCMFKNNYIEYNLIKTIIPEDCPLVIMGLDYVKINREN